MLCCVSRNTSSSGRANNEDCDDDNYRKKLDFEPSNYTSSTSSVSNGEFGSSATSGGFTFSSTSSSTSGFSSGSSSICGFSNTTSDASSSNSDFSGKLYESPIASEISSSPRSPPIPPKRMQTFSAPARNVNFSIKCGGGEKETSGEDAPPSALLPCAICGRTFRPESLEKHTVICERSAIKKRKPFDSAKQRIQGTELAEFLPKETVKRKVHAPEDKQSATDRGSWKQTRDELIRTIRAARGETIDVPPHRPVAAAHSVMVGVPTRPNEKGTCPTCDRHFSIKSYERHVAWCKEKAGRVPMTPATHIAKERLEARMKYRAPALKNRRPTNREKYSPGSAINLPSIAGKNSPPNQRAKESASTPSCNKGGNEAASASDQKQKSTTTGRRSGQAREGMQSGPMKSRLSDRSSRPSAEIASGPTTSLSPRSIPPRCNSHRRHSRHSPTRPVFSKRSTSPISTLSSRNESAATDCNEITNSRRSERPGYDEISSNTPRHYPRKNIVSARSYGNPKINNISINDEVIGMTVQPCGVKRIVNDHEELTTWKQISAEKNMRQICHLRLDGMIDEEDFVRRNREIEELEDSRTMDRKEDRSLKSSADFGNISWMNEVSRLDRTYLIRESLDREIDFLGNREEFPTQSEGVIDSPEAIYPLIAKTPRIKGFCDDSMSVNKFDFDAKVTSSPLKFRDEELDSNREKNNGARGTSPLLSGRSKLKPLKLKIVAGDENCNNENITSRSGRNTTPRKIIPQLKPIIGKNLVDEKPLNFRSHDEEIYENLSTSKQSLEDMTLKIRGVESDEFSKFLSSVKETESVKFRSHRKIARKRARTGTMMLEKNDSETPEKNFEILTKKHEFGDLDLQIKSEGKVELQNAEKSPRNSNIFENDYKLSSTQNPLKIQQSIGGGFDFRSLNVNFENSTGKRISDELKSVARIYETPERLDISRVNLDKKSSKCDTTSSREKASISAIEKKSSSDEALELEICKNENIENLAKKTCCLDESTKISDLPNREVIKKIEHVLSDTEMNKSVESLAEKKSHPVEQSAEPRNSPESKISTCRQRKKFVEENQRSLELQPTLQRCGTYVIDGATTSGFTTKHLVSDGSCDDNPRMKKRKIEQKTSEISSSDKTPDTIANLLQNLSIVKTNTIDDSDKSGRAKSVSDLRMKKTDEIAKEIVEKYVNQHFDYDSDNTTGGDNLPKNSNNPEEGSTIEGKLSSNNEISYIELPVKALSDSFVTREKKIADSSLHSSRDNIFAQSPKEIEKKLEEKMCLLRGSTDTLISSLETSGVNDTEESAITIVSRKTESDEQRISETVRKLEFGKIGVNVSTTRTDCCSYLPQIPVDRIAARSEKKKIEKKFAGIDSSLILERARNNSRARLINLDPSKCQDNIDSSVRPSKLVTLPPVVPAAFRKIKRRSSVRESRAVWSNYVRRRPDFDLVLTGRTGKDYDPFLIAERQMNELMSDTCSDQSFTDSPSNRRRSSSPIAPNYPLTHSSAFVKYPDPVARGLANSDKRASLIAPPTAFDDSIGDFSSDSTETNSISRDILADLEDVSRSRINCDERDGKRKNTRELGRRVIIDKSKALGTNELLDDSGSIRPNRGISQTNVKARKILDNLTPKVLRPHVNRSSSMRSTSAPKIVERKNNGSAVSAINNKNSRSTPQSGMNNRNNNYASLSGSNVSLSSIVSSEIDVKRSNSISDELASSFEDDASGTYPSLRSLLKNDSLSVSSPVQTSRPRNGQISDEELSSPDSYKRQDMSKLSADSAYSSLNRKHSNHGRSTNDMAIRNDGDSPLRRRDGEIGTSAASKMSKFCHECGCKFFVESAKFCCECGMQRLAV